MKIKMNNAVGPQVRTAKPKPSKLLPVLGAASMVGGPPGRDAVLRPHVRLSRDPRPQRGPRVRALVDPALDVQVVQPVPGRDHEGRQHGDAGFDRGPAGRGRGEGRHVQQLEGERVPARLGPLAEKKDIQAAGLLPRERNVLEIVTGKAAPTATGVYVGGWQDKDGNFFYLRHSGPEHVLTYAPTRSARASAWWCRRCCRGARAASSPT
ncbi:Conjugal transfer protein TraG [Achromobacter xylosoxidans]|nr:Conjugal transfer protein TraG [Achromobacter xylosoxidans]CUR71492.1 Conjugal transfer protein TraG [Achromobacter xylosoxidans]